MDTVLNQMPVEEHEALLRDMATTGKTDLVNLQMVLATSSMNHEYTRKAYERTRSYARKEELLAKMSNLKNLYFAARNKLAAHSPDRLETIERELSYQKQAVLSEHGLH